MSHAKRSRATGNLVRLDAGKKDHTTPIKPKPPDAAPLIHCLQVKVILSDGRSEWVEVANYPAEGGLDAFYDLIHRAPDDGFMTSDARWTLAFASIAAIRRPKDPADEYPVKVERTPVGEPRRLYRRLRTVIRLGREEAVEVANVPWNDLGIAHFGRVVSRHRRCDFVTTDHGFLPVRGLSLEDLIMPDDPPASRIVRLAPGDILRPEDLPE